MLGLIVHTQAAGCRLFDPSLYIVGGLALGRLWKGDSSPPPWKTVLQLLTEGLAWSCSPKALLPSVTLGAHFPGCPVPPGLALSALTMRMV